MTKFQAACRLTALAALVCFQTSLADPILPVAQDGGSQENMEDYLMHDIETPNGPMTKTGPKTPLSIRRVLRQQAQAWANITSISKRTQKALAALLSGKLSDQTLRPGRWGSSPAVCLPTAPPTPLYQRLFSTRSPTRSLLLRPASSTSANSMSHRGSPTMAPSRSRSCSGPHPSRASSRTTFLTHVPLHRSTSV